MTSELPWPEPGEWLAALRASVLMTSPPVLRLYEERLLYLDRYWREEEQVCADLLAHVGVGATVDETWLEAALDRDVSRGGL